MLTPTESSVQTPAATPVNNEPSPTKAFAVTIPAKVELPPLYTPIVTALPTRNPLEAVTIPVAVSYTHLTLPTICSV